MSNNNVPENTNSYNLINGTGNYVIQDRYDQKSLNSYFKLKDNARLVDAICELFVFARFWGQREIYLELDNGYTIEVVDTDDVYIEDMATNICNKISYHYCCIPDAIKISKDKGELFSVGKTGDDILEYIRALSFYLYLSGEGKINFNIMHQIFTISRKDNYDEKVKEVFLRLFSNSFTDDNINKLIAKQRYDAPNHIIKLAECFQKDYSKNI